MTARPRAPVRGVAAALLVVGVAVALLAGLERARGRSALAEAQAARLRGELPLAIAAARVAAEARVPFTEHADAALTLLESLADDAVTARDPAMAGLALRVARQAAEATQQAERAQSLGLREHAVETAKKATELAGDPLAAPPEPGMPSPAAVRPTGIGRGPVSWVAQLAMTLGVLSVGGALAAVWWSRRLRWGAALGAVGTALLAVARLLP